MTDNNNDYVVNPKTLKPIKIGGKVHKQLIKQGLLAYHEEKVLDDLPEDENQISEKIEELNKTLPTNQQAVRGRGRFKGKIVKRDKALTPNDVQQIATNLAKTVITKNKELIEENEDPEELNQLIEDLILEEINGTKIKKKYYTTEQEDYE